MKAVFETRGLFVKKRGWMLQILFHGVDLIYLYYIFQIPSVKINFDTGKYLVGVKMKKNK